MIGYLRFLVRCFRVSFVGDWRYHAWMTLLTIVALLGLNAWARQLVEGMATTGLTDHVTWGLYIANFVFLVGLASGAVLFTLPHQLRGSREARSLLVCGELLAGTALLMSMAFVVVDLGRPDRMLHMFRRLNLPDSMLAWDVVVLGGFLLVLLHIGGYTMYATYRGRRPARILLLPFVVLATVWAVGVPVGDALLFVGYESRPFWDSLIVVPRFLIASLCVGGGFLAITLSLVAAIGALEIPRRVLANLRRALVVILALDLALLAGELYVGSSHGVTVEYLLFGAGDHQALVPWAWTSIGLTVLALLILVLPVSRSARGMNVACVAMVAGLWLDKTMLFVIPGFVPTPLGEIVEYSPTWNETIVCLGIWAFGLLVYSILVRITVPVLSGRLTAGRSTESRPSEAPSSSARSLGSPHGG